MQPENQAREAVRIREAEARDRHGISACLAAAFEPYRARYTAGMFADTVPAPDAIEERRRHMRVWVACAADGDIAGTLAHAVVGGGEGHLRGMAVKPAYQGRGIAAQLLQAAEAALRRDGCTIVTLDTTEPLAPAVRFYERHGYRPSGRRQTQFGMTLVEYCKTLRP